MKKKLQSIEHKFITIACVFYGESIGTHFDLLSQPLNVQYQFTGDHSKFHVH